MSKKKISLGEAVTDVEVELFGVTFKALTPTRSVLKDAGELEDALEAADNNDVSMDLIGRMLDARLKATNGGRKKPSQIIKEKWEADELSLPQIQMFVADLTEAQFARPT